MDFIPQDSLQSRRKRAILSAVFQRIVRGRNADMLSLVLKWTVGYTGSAMRSLQDELRDSFARQEKTNSFVKRQP